MPAATEYVTKEDSAEFRALREAANREFQERQKLSEMNWNYYRGRHRKNLLIEDGVDHNVVLNLCRPMIDRIISFLFPEMPGFELDDEADTEPEQWLTDVWEHNGGAVLMSDMALNGALNGQVYARVNPAGNEADPPEIINLNPANIITFWKADDYRKVLWYEIQWKSGKTEYRQDVVADGETWVIKDYKKDNKWKMTKETLWNSPLGPIVDWKHLPRPNEYYGETELFHAGLNDAVNRIASDMNKILYFYGAPTTIGTGFDGGEVQQTGIGRFWTVPKPDAKIYNLEMQGDLAASHLYLQTLMNLFTLQSRVAMISASPDTFRGMTNLGIRAFFMDMIAKNEVLRRMYGWGIQQISRRVLMIGEYPSEMPPKLKWGEALPVDHREEVDLVQKQTEMNLMSKRTAASELGLNYENEVDRQIEEKDIEGLLMDRKLNGPIG